MRDRPAKPIVLIVDDQPENVEVLVQTLDELCDLRVALTGPEALEVTESASAPDLILLDIVMPGMDGYEVCRRLKSDEKTKNIPVLFLTALDDIEDEVKGLQLGAIDYLTKPIRPAIVRSRVRNHLDYKRHRDLLENLASIDGLTDVANRRRFDEILEKEWTRCFRSGSPISVIMIDIDFFKNFNDNYGHGAGDDCLRKIAASIADSTQRPGDLVARYGGEEFAIVLPETNPAGAVVVGERVQACIAKLNIPHAFSRCSDRVTVSIGIGTAVPRLSTGAEVLLEAADGMLYQAKQEGRNCLMTCVL